MSSSERVMPFSFDIIETNLFHLKSAQDNFIKKIGKPSCFTIANTSNKKNFQYAGVPFNGVHKIKCLVISNKRFNRLLEISTKHPSSQLIYLHFCIAMLILLLKLSRCITE